MIICIILTYYYKNLNIKNKLLIIYNMNNIQDTNVNDLVEMNKVNKLSKTKRKNSFIKNDNSIIAASPKIILLLS